MKTREELIKMLGTETQVGLSAQGITVFDKSYSFQELDEILSAPTEEQMKCQYCYPEYPSMDYQKFNYCPHCGRKLGDEWNAQKS